jgi:two-component sensor histidine kinase
MEYNRYDSAASYFHKSLDLVDPADERQVMVIKNGLGQVYLHTGQYQKCIDLLSEALVVVQKTGEIFFMTELPEYIAQSYAGLGQYDSAYKYMEMNWRYTDSLFTQDQDKALQEMKSKYESDQKDVLIARQKIERNYGFALFSTACVLAFMFYRRYRSKKKMNQILDQSNQEKGFLLREIHHRVKNNLQILSSLLNLQADYIKDENAQSAITEGRNRVQSMSFIHQQLYSEDNVATVNMREFLADLCGHLSDTFGTDQKRIQIRRDVRVELFDIETAIPLGLIVNELITNSIKYAFHQRDQGMILIKLWENENSQLCLQVSDDGEGSTTQIAPADGSGFGADLIKILSKKLKGTIETKTTGGYSTLIRFDRYALVKEGSQQTVHPTLNQS